MSTVISIIASCVAAIPLIAAAAPASPAPVIFRGMCDASAAAALGTNWFVVADDEGNQLRVYDAERGGDPLEVVELTPFLRLSGRFPEADVEGAAWLNGRIYWIGSHGRNAEGKYRPNRHCFFATTVAFSSNGPPRLAPAGVCYKFLLSDLLWDARYQPFNLAAASARPPKAKGGLNIEGLCATADGRLLIGFRNPLSNRRALVAPMLNAEEVVAGKRARFGDPIQLDLGGLGIRDFVLVQKDVYLIAGPYDAEKEFRLFVWHNLKGSPRVVEKLDFSKTTPEALVAYPAPRPMQILSDDGTLKVKGIDCKHAPPADRRFHAIWLEPSS